MISAGDKNIRNTTSLPIMKIKNLLILVSQLSALVGPYLPIAFVRQPGKLFSQLVRAERQTQTSCCRHTEASYLANCNSFERRQIIIE